MVLLSLLGMAFQPSALGQAPSTDVAVLIEKMTLDEKLTLLHGAQDPTGQAGAGYVPGIERLGIPELRLADGPAGIRASEPATALPAPAVLASTFDPELARQFGSVIGREGRALGQDVLLSPMVNIVRVPQAGRNFETFGEDPVLASKMVAAEIRGIQSGGLLATVKHYTANNFEQERQTVSAEVGPRPLREIYLPGFEAAVDAGVGAVMCAYNRVNGTYACSNKRLLSDILKSDFGFEGWVMTDWFARHDLHAIEAGLDQEMPGFSFPGVPQPVLFSDSLRAAVEAGRIPESEVDASVRRFLTQLKRMDLLGGSVPPRPEMDEAAGAEVARDVAASGAVLLRNEGGMLPLDGDVSAVAVIGPTAQRPLYGGGGSSHVQPTSLDAPLEALRQRLGADVEVRYAMGVDHDGVPVPASALTPEEGSDVEGLRRETEGEEPGPVDLQVDMTGENALPPGTSRTWTGTLTAPTTGSYDLKLQTRGGGGTLTMDGEELLTTQGFFSDASLIPTADSLNTASATVDLEAGTSHPIQVQVQGGGGNVFFGPGEEQPVEVRLAWVTPERRKAVRAEAVEAAQAADAAVVFAYNEGTEGNDRGSLSLPGTQDALVASVAEANASTAVVLSTGDPVTMPWLQNVASVLQTWYSGQEGAEATAALLTGDEAPSGRLPVTFPREASDAPTAPQERYPGVDGQAEYSEGIFVGYRWYDEQDIEPLFPFGHGLAYTTFDYSDLQVEVGDDSYVARFQVQNTGDRAGTAVPQVYLGRPADPPVEMAPKQLAGFDRVELEPGESQTITVEIGTRDLSYWSVEADGWQVATGTRPVYVGASSRDLVLEGEITVE